MRQYRWFYFNMLLFYHVNLLSTIVTIDSAACNLKFFVTDTPYKRPNVVSVSQHKHDIVSTIQTHP